MITKAFPKPLPVEPLPLEVWLGDADRAEAGREAFFQGRDLEYGVFQNAASMLQAGRVGGGTMVFQGAQGSGKSALMAECMEAVRLHSTPENPWVAASIGPAALMSAADVVMIMIEEASRERQQLLERFPEQMPKKFENLRDIGQKLLSELVQRSYTVSSGGLDVTMHGKPASTFDQEGILAERAFRDAAPLFKDIHMVIFVDEAQNTPVSESTKAVMDCLHRDAKGIPLIAAFFGLSDTKNVLRQCGLSRFAGGRVKTLDPLSHEEAANAIQAVFNTYGFEGSAKIKAAWANELAELSQGWPQHIKNVSVAAAMVIRDHGGFINEELLSKTIELVQEMKEEYYTHRLDACSGHPWVYKRLAQAALGRNGILSWHEIDEITQFARSNSGQSTDDFLIDALHGGVLTEISRLPKHYEFPIPSLGDYLRALPVVPPPGSLP